MKNAIYTNAAAAMDAVKAAAVKYNELTVKADAAAVDVAAAKAALNAAAAEYNAAARHEAFIAARLAATDAAPALNALAIAYTAPAVKVKYDARANGHADVDAHAAQRLNPLDALADARDAAADAPAARDVAAALDALADAVKAALNAAVKGASDADAAAVMPVANVKRTAGKALQVMGFTRVKVKADAAAYIVLTAAAVKGVDVAAVVGSRRVVAGALFAAAHVILCGKHFAAVTAADVKAARKAAADAVTVKAADAA